MVRKTSTRTVLLAACACLGIALAGEGRGAAAESLDLDLGGGVTMHFVRVPGGEFVMGSPESEPGHHPQEGPQHPVRITRDFYLGVYEVTDAQYEHVMGTGSPYGRGGDHPADGVPWNDAAAFCQQISLATGRPCRLPTEAEWEYACRAGSTRAYYWGDQIDPAYAWYDTSSGWRAHPVGQKLPNAFDLYDMSGNVWEWCQDWFAYYEANPTPVEDPQGPPTGETRVMRGGSWGNHYLNVRSAVRNDAAPPGSHQSVGFRVAITISGNMAPQALDDAYEVDEAGALDVPAADGLLANDEDPDEDPLTAVLVGGPANGALALDPDGSFTYAPDVGFYGQDTFTYRASDGTHTSNMATARIQINPLSPPAYDLDLGGGVTMHFVRVPAGEFLMGSPEPGPWHPPWESPQHAVRITRDFYLGVYEVTDAQYEHVMGTASPYGRGGDHPAEGVSWNDAAEFCERISLATGHVCRFPTEAQWEYACRAGSTTIYYWGDQIDDEYAWYTGNSGAMAHPVGQKRRNQFGLHDMSGNVWEWCQDWFAPDYYAESPFEDPPGPATGDTRVIRGGFWGNPQMGLRSAMRLPRLPNGGYTGVGFRVLRVDTEPPVAVALANGHPTHLTIEEASPGGTPVCLDGSQSSDPDGDSISYEWDFDNDGVVDATGPVATATYALGGPYTVALKVTDSYGAFGTDIVTITVVPGSVENQLANLARLVEMGIDDGQIAEQLDQALLAKVNAAMNSLARGKPNSTKPAVNQLRALANQVNAQRNKMISSAMAEQIMTRINRAISNIGT